MSASTPLLSLSLSPFFLLFPSFPLSFLPVPFLDADGGGSRWLNDTGRREARRRRAPLRLPDLEGGGDGARRWWLATTISMTTRGDDDLDDARGGAQRQWRQRLATDLEEGDGEGGGSR